MISLSINVIYDFTLELEALFSIVLNLDIAFSLKYPFTRGNYLGKLQLFLKISVAFTICLLTYVIIKLF